MGLKQAPGYQVIQEKGTSLPRQIILNAIGQNVEAKDNPSTGVTDLRIIARYYDAIVTDEAVVDSTISAFTSIQEAIASGALSIFVRAGFLGGFTVLPGDRVTRIVGETPGSANDIGVRISSDVTIQKADLLMEQVLFSGILGTVTVRVQASGVTFLACAWKGVVGTSTVDLNASATDTLFLFCRPEGNSSATGWVTFSGAASRPKFIQCTITGYTGAASIIDDGGMDIRGGQISACSFLNNTNTAFLVSLPASLQWEIAGNFVRRCDGGAFDVNFSAVTGNTIDGVAVVSGGIGIRGDGVFSANTISDVETGIVAITAGAGFTVITGNMILALGATPVAMAIDAFNASPIIAGNLLLGTVDLRLSASGSQIISSNLFAGGGVTGGFAGSQFIGNIGHGLRGTVLTPQVDDEVTLGTAALRFAKSHVNDVTVYQEHFFPQQSLVLVNGNNDNVSITDGKFYRITGPSAAFAIRTIDAPVDGREIILYNSTAFDMTISNNAVIFGPPTERILTLTGADVTLTAQSLARLIYSGADGRWILTGIQGWNLRAAGADGLMIALAEGFPSPDPKTVHIWAGNAGAIAAGANRQLVIESDVGAGIQLLTPNNKTIRISFGDPESNNAGQISYRHGDELMRFRVNNISQLDWLDGVFKFLKAHTISTAVGDLTLTAAGKVNVPVLLATVASSPSSAGLRLPHGSAPTAPVDGDMWTTTAGLFVRINGSTIGPLT